MSIQRPALGRGLSALIPQTGAGGALESVDIDLVAPNPQQPRIRFDREALEELAASILEHGVLQPIIVTRTGDQNGPMTYQLVAGERRLQAARLAGLTRIPVLIKEAAATELLELALVENIQREDLNPLEEAQALQRLIDEFDLTHAAAAEAVGRSRAAVSNLLRLLELPEAVRQLMQAGAIEMGHARALLPLAEPMAVALAKQAAEEGWSVRQVEHRVQQLAAGKLPVAPKKSAPKARPPQADIAALERELSETLGSKVNVLNGRGNKGKLVIHYANLDALDGVLERLRNRS